MSQPETVMVVCLAALLCAPGTPYAGDDPALHIPRLKFQWKSGQYVVLTNDDDAFYGYAAWYRCDDDVLKSIGDREQDEWVRNSRFPELTAGPNCYIADVIMSPSAPFTACRQIIDRVADLNLDAKSISAHHVRRDGRERFVYHENDGRPRWWRR